MASRNARRKKRRANKKAQAKLVQFDRIEDDIKAAESSKVRGSIKRSKRLAEDLSDVARGRGRRKDLAGREKKRVWESARFKEGMLDAAVVAGLASGAYIAANRKGKGRRGLKRAAREDLAKLKKTLSTPIGKRTARNNIGRSLRRRIMGFEARPEKTGPERLLEFARKDKKKKSNKKALLAYGAAGGFSAYALIRMLRAKRNPGMSVEDAIKYINPERAAKREFASKEDWEITPVSRRVARVRAPGARKRNRREKTWSEKKANRDKIAIAATIGGTLAGALTAGGIARRSMKRQVKQVRLLEKQANVAQAGEKVAISTPRNNRKLGQSPAAMRPNRRKRPTNVVDINPTAKNKRRRAASKRRKTNNS